MTRDEIEKILASILEKEERPFDLPTIDEWNDLSKKFNCKFSDDFKYFIELMSEYSFPGDIHNVSFGRTNGNDSIALVYDYEMQDGNWNADLIPFYGIGNGDYFCISAKESPNSHVYYFYHDDLIIEQYSNDFEEWINGLPTFLA
ncbi:MAG TPA: SMI1/KNR4 family protein [Clostridia bacterium]